MSRYAILSTPPEAAFDDITQLASYFFRCPVALLSLVEGPRRRLLSCVGLDFREGPRAESFCEWAIPGDCVMVVPDATTDPRFCENIAVTDVASFRFYAGAPLISSRGYHLGTLCIIDTVPRPEGLTTAETDALAKLAALAMHALEARLVLQESEDTRALLKTTLDSIGDGVIVTDADSKVTFLNPVAEQITGWKLDQALTHPIQEVFPIVHETTREPVTNPISRAFSGCQVVGPENHTILLTKDHREVLINDNAAPIYRGDWIAGGVLVFRDVTRRRGAERALEYSENQFRATFANAPLGQVLTHVDGRFIEANQAFRSLTGYSAEELSSLDLTSLTHAEEIENNRALLQQLVSGEINSYVIEKRIFTKGHILRWVRAHKSLLRSGDGVQVIGLVEDITDRKLAEQRFRFLAESIPQMVWTATPDGILDYVNGIAAEYFQAPEAGLLGTGWLTLVHPDDQSGAVELWTTSLRTGEAYETQVYLKRAHDSSWRKHLVRALPLKAENQAVLHWFGTFTDIEDQHQATRVIEQDRQHWRDLLLKIPVGIAVLRGPQHRFALANADYTRLVGRSAEMLLGKTVAEAFPELKTQGYSELLERVYQTGEPFVGREEHIRLDKGNVSENLCLNFLYLPTKDENEAVDGIFVYVTDVTEMVAGRRAIEESEAQFRSLAETIPHLAWMAHQNGDIFWYNQRWFDYTGQTFTDMQGWGWQSVHDPAVLPEVLARWRGAIAAGEIFEMVFPLRGADGEFCSFLTRVVPVKDSKGNVVRWFGTNTDITGQRRTEEHLRRINRDLEEFSYVASHDLQEPLRMVNIYTQLMCDQNGTSKEDLEQFSGFVLKGVKRMETLIQDLLAFSRTVHTEELIIGEADLSGAFEEALSVLKTRVEETGARITVSALPTTRGDTAQMAHVFQNVLSNALKYLKPDVTPQIDVAARRDIGKWVISIRDNGIGFEPQHAERIFGLFKRLHKDEYPGTGLGLAICKRIVERYGGQMWAESAGEGATFHFSLPCVGR